MTNIEHLGKLHPDIITNFLEIGRSDGIPAKLQPFIMQISWAAEIFTYEQNISAAARKLKQRIYAVQQVKVSEYECRARINDALNFFSVDNNVSQEVWDMKTADRFIAISQMAVAKGDLKAALIAEKEANFYRSRASSATSNGTKTINFLLTPSIKAEDLGFTDKNRKQIAKKSNDGFYINLIENLPIEADEKKQLFDDAEVVDQ